MSNSTNGTDPTGGIPALPDSLNLPPHLSAHKYFFVCTLTVAAWDTLVLSPRSYRLLRTKEWPLLKIAFHFLRVFMPVEFTIVGVAFFDTKWSLDVSTLLHYLCPHMFPHGLVVGSCERNYWSKQHVDALQEHTTERSPVYECYIDTFLTELPQVLLIRAHLHGNPVGRVLSGPCRSYTCNL